MIKLITGILRLLLNLVALLAILWSTAALLYDLPFTFWIRVAVSAVWLCVALLVWFRSRFRFISRLAVIVGFAAVFGWWIQLQPSATRDWKPEVEVLARAEINNDSVTFYNLRNFEYTSAEVFTPRYETRTYDLNKLKGLDIFLSKWGSEVMGHPVVSFDFGTEGHLAFSIEIRPEKGEAFDPLGAICRKFELFYVPADERDIIRVRTNIRTTEKVYLYKIKTTPERARERLTEYVTRLNQLYNKPEWYNIVTANCTTSIRAQRPSEERIPWDWRILFNGSADEMLYEHGGLDQTYSFEELKRRSQINETAKAAGDAPDFSERIRQGLPGFE